MKTTNNNRVVEYYKANKKVFLNKFCSLNKILLSDVSANEEAFILFIKEEMNKEVLKGLNKIMREALK